MNGQSWEKCDGFAPDSQDPELNYHNYIIKYINILKIKSMQSKVDYLEEKSEDYQMKRIMWTGNA